MVAGNAHARGLHLAVDPANLVDSRGHLLAVVFRPPLVHRDEDRAIKQLHRLCAHVLRVVRQGAFVVGTGEGTAFVRRGLLLQNLFPVAVDMPVPRSSTAAPPGGDPLSDKGLGQFRGIRVKVAL